MTRDDARTLSVGKMVVSRHSSPPYRPYRISKLYLPETGTPMVQIAAYRPGEWVHLEAFDLPPKGQVWDQLRGQWRPK